MLREIRRIVKAVVNHGAIRSLEPLPGDWREGQALSVEKLEVGDISVEEIDRDFALLAKLCSASDVADEALMQHALDDANRQAKEHVRRQMGLS